MNMIFTILFFIVYEYASISAFQSLHQNRTNVSLIQIKYPIITSHMPFFHKFYHIVVYVILFYKAFL